MAINQTLFDPFNPMEQGGSGPVGPMGPQPGVAPGLPTQEKDEWGRPTGRWITYDANGRPGPYQAPSAGGRDSSGQIGLNPATGRYEYFTYGTDGKPRFGGVAAPPMNMNPGFSSSVSQSYSDPRMIEIQGRQLEETIRGNLAQEAKDRELLSFNRDKLRVEIENGDKDRALKTQEMMASISSRIEQNAIARQSLIQQRDMANADRQARAQENAANLAQRETESRRADATTRARAVAEYSASPTDVGKVSGLLNMGGMSNLSTAIGQGQTAIDVEPLAGLLAPDVQQAPQAQPQPVGLNSAMARGQQMANAINQQYAQSSQTWSDPNGTGKQMIPGATNVIGQGAVSYGTPQSRNDANNRMAAEGVPDWVPRFEDGGAVVDGEETDGDGEVFLNGLMKLVHMLGMQPKAIAGEKGKANGETVYSNGDVVVMPDKGEGMDMPEMAQGGGVLNPLMQYATDFQKRVGQTALQRSGFEKAPTPIELSDPGTDPFRQQLGAATTAAVTGIPASAFLNELMKLRPQGMQRGFASRTR